MLLLRRDDSHTSEVVGEVVVDVEGLSASMLATSLDPGGSRLRRGGSGQGHPCRQRVKHNAATMRILADAGFTHIVFFVARQKATVPVRWCAVAAKGRFTLRRAVLMGGTRRRRFAAVATEVLFA